MALLLPVDSGRAIVHGAVTQRGKKWSIIQMNMWHWSKNHFRQILQVAHPYRGWRCIAVSERTGRGNPDDRTALVVWDTDGTNPRRVFRADDVVLVPRQDRFERVEIARLVIDEKDVDEVHQRYNQTRSSDKS